MGRHGGHEPVQGQPHGSVGAAPHGRSVRRPRQSLLSLDAVPALTLRR